MYPNIELSASLDENTVLYRTLDFFSAAKILTSNQLMFTRADMFQDKNEGVERLLTQLSVSGPKSGCGMGWNDKISAREHHDSLKRSYYISSWSLTQESVAMWSLYSPDCCSVRISTTVAKLRVALSNLLEKYSFINNTDLKQEEKYLMSLGGWILPVEYHSLAELSKSARIRAKARIRLAERYVRKGTPIPSLNMKSVTTKPKNHEDKFYRLLDKKFNLKDLSFQHEKEVRLIVRLGEGGKNLDIETKMLIEQNYKELNSLLNVYDPVSKNRTPEREFVACPNDFIESVAIDPRCPSHKLEFMSTWFQSYEVSIIESSCFGYIPNSFDIFPFH